MFRKLSILGIAVSAIGCASTQLTYNSVDIASSVSDLYTRQVLTNLSKFIDEPYSIPSQVDLTAGTIQTSNSVTPGISTPLSRSVTKNGLGQITSTALAGSGLTINASDSWQQNWNVAPISDANTLRNLRAIYRYAVYGGNLIADYHIPRIAKNGKFPPDPYWLELPQCVVCKPAGYRSFFVNPMLVPAWLFWTSDPGSPVPERVPPYDSAMIDLGHYGSHELLMRREDFQAGLLANFTLFLLPNGEPSETAKSGGGRSAAPGDRPNYSSPPPPAPPQILPAPPL